MFKQDFLSQQLVMEYCLGSASDLLEGELTQLLNGDIVPLCKFAIITLLIMINAFQFTRNPCKKLK